MRYLALLLVLLAPAALGNVPCYGGTVVYAPTVADCPKRISDVSITPTVGGFDLSYASEGGLTLEVAVEAGHDQKCPGCPYATNTSDQTERRINYARLDDQAIKNGTGMSAETNQDASVAGNYTVSVTGLGDEAAYSVHLLPIESDDSYGQAWQLNVTTLTAAGDEALAGAQRFNKAAGNDLADGLTHATAWQTGTNCEVGMPTSADCRFLAGDAFHQEQFIIANSGTIDDFTVFGCYRWNGSEEVECDFSTDTRPTFGRDLTPTCITNANCAGSAEYYFTGYSVANGFVGQVDIQADYVEVSGLDVSYTAAMAIRASGSGNGPAHTGSRHHIIIADNVLAYNGKQQLVVMNGVQNFAVLRNDLSNGGQCFVEGARNGLSSQAARAPLCDGGAWGASLGIFRNYNAHGLIENNDVHDTPQEGINVNQGTSHVVVRGNRVGNTHSTSGYCDMCTYAVWESNILWGVFGDVGNWTVGGSFGGGFGSNVERNDYGNVEYNVIRNNISVDSGQASLVANTFTENGNPYAAGKFTQWFLYGNTFVSADSANLRLTRTQSSSEMHSNVFVTDDVTAGSTCLFSSVESLTLDRGYNAWNPNPTQSTCDGANDVTVATLGLASTETDWDAADYATDRPTIADFRITNASSDLIGAGDPGLETENLPNGLDHSDFGTWIWQHTAYPWAINSDQKRLNWSKKLYYDFEGTARDATTPDIGAVEYAP